MKLPLILALAAMVSMLSGEEFFFRVRLDSVVPAGQPTKLMVRVYWPVHLRIAALGVGTPGTAPDFKGRNMSWKDVKNTVASGEFSDWIPLGKYLPEPDGSRRNNFKLGNPFVLSVAAHQESRPAEHKLFARWRDAGNVEQLGITLEWTDDPGAGAKLSIRASADYMLIPFYFPPGQYGEAQTLSELLKRQLFAFEQAGVKEFTAAGNFKVTGGKFDSPHVEFYSPADKETENRIQAYFGVNRHYEGCWHFTRESMFRKLDPWGDETLEWLLNRKKFSFPDGSLIKMSDEVNILPVKELAASANGLDRFRRYLRDRGLAPDQLGFGAWEQVMPLERDKVTNAKSALLHYYTIWFLQESGAELCAVSNRAFHRRFGDNFETFTSVHRADRTFSSMPDYFIESRAGAFDRQGHHYGSGDRWGPGDYMANIFIADLLRSAAEQGRIKPGLLWFTCRIAQFEGIIQSGVTALGRGFDFFHLYGSGPVYKGGEWLCSDRKKVDAVVGVNTVMRIAAGYDGYWDPAYRPRAKVALVLDRAGDIWRNFGPDSNADITGLERRMLNYVLATSGWPIDIVPEESIEEGKGAGYAAIYYASPNLTRRAGKALAGYVKQGGILYLGALAATRDEANQPYDLLEKEFGRRMAAGVSGCAPAAPPIVTERRLGRALNPLTLELAGRQYPLPANLEILKPGTANVLARYTGGDPAFAVFGFGRGKVYKSGMPLASALCLTAVPPLDKLRTGEKIFNTHEGYKYHARHTLDKQLTDLILKPLRDNGIEPAYRLSEYGLDVNLLTKPDGSGALLVLARYNAEKGKVTVTLPETAGKFNLAASFSGRDVTLDKDGKYLQCTLELDVADVVELKTGAVK